MSLVDAHLYPPKTLLTGLSHSWCSPRSLWIGQSAVLISLLQISPFVIGWYAEHWLNEVPFILHILYLAVVTESGIMSPIDIVSIPLYCSLMTPLVLCCLKAGVCAIWLTCGGLWISQSGQFSHWRSLLAMWSIALVHINAVDPGCNHRAHGPTKPCEQMD